jgi:hypothetical protein
LVTGLLEGLAGGEGEPGFMVVLGREKKATEERAVETEEGRWTWKRKAEEKLKKHFRGGKAVALVSLNKN